MYTIKNVHLNIRTLTVAVLHCIHITEPQIIPAVLTITSPLGSLVGSVYLHPPAVWQGDPHGKEGDG